MRDDIFGESLYRTVLSAIIFHKTFDHSEITIIIASEALIFLIGLVMMDESRTQQDWSYCNFYFTFRFSLVLTFGKVTTTTFRTVRGAIRKALACLKMLTLARVFCHGQW